MVGRDLRGRQVKRFSKTLAEARVKRRSCGRTSPAASTEDSRGSSFADYAVGWIAHTTGGPPVEYGRARSAPTSAISDSIRTATRPVTAPSPSSADAARHDHGAGREAYAAECVKAGLARNTIRLRIAPVKALLATAHEEGLIRANPAAG